MEDFIVFTAVGFVFLFVSGMVLLGIAVCACDFMKVVLKNYPDKKDAMIVIFATASAIALATFLSYHTGAILYALH